MLYNLSKVTEQVSLSLTSVIYDHTSLVYQQLALDQGPE